MTAEPEIEYDKSVVGVDVEAGTVDVTRDMIAAFCGALDETNPLYTDDAAAAQGPYGTVIAPPAIVTTFKLQQGLDPKVQFGNTTFAAGHHIDIFEPIRVGDTITAKTQVKEVYPKTGRTGTMVFVVRRISYSNQHGRPVANAEFSQVFREV